MEPEDVEHELKQPEQCDVRRSSGRPILFGRTADGECIAVVYEELDDETVYPITAFLLED